MRDEADITQLLHDVDKGRPGAMDELMEAVYAELERIARRHLEARFGAGLPGVTLEPAALVNESFLRLLRQRKGFGGRVQFFAIVTKVMLRVLLDYQRGREAARRGGDRRRITLVLDALPRGAGEPASDEGLDVERLAAALERLEALDPRKADVVRMKFLGGLEMREVAEALGVSLATVERDWAFSKAWLARECRSEGDGAPPRPARPGFDAVR